MESRRSSVRCLSLIIGGAIGAIALAAQGQTLNVNLTSKTFNPVSIPVGGQSTLTVSVTNSTGAQINNVAFTDTLPAGLTAITFLMASGCGVGTVGYGTTSTTVFATVAVPAGGTCAVSYVVTASAPGVYTNGTVNITSWNGNALAFPAASLVVGLNPPIPTLSQFSLLLLALGVAVMAYAIRFRPSRPRLQRRS